MAGVRRSRTSSVECFVDALKGLKERTDIVQLVLIMLSVGPAVESEGPLRR